MGWVKYIGKLFKLAFRLSFGRADTISGFTIAIFYGIGKLSKLETIMNIDLWWLPLIVLGAVFAIRLLLAPYWIYKDKVAEINRLSALIDNQDSASEGTAADGSPLDFSVEMESITQRSGPVFFGRDLDTQNPLSWLMVDISFRTNQVIQIASLHLEIDPIDPRDIIEPDSDLAQGFSLPHILHRAETHRFQFQLLPENAEGKHKLLLKVLAGGRWYTDGPYTLNRQE